MSARPLLWLVLMLVALPAAASAQSTEHAGRMVRAIDILAPRGVDEASLRYLIEQPLDQLYDVRKIGRSVELIFRLGTFDQVEVRAREVTDGVALTFVVQPSPRIRRIVLKGVRRVLPSTLRAGLRRTAGDPYVPGDEIRLARDVEAAYRALGFLDVKVQHGLGRSRLPGGGKVIELTVVEGVPYRIGEIAVLPAVDAGWQEAKIERLLRPGLREGGRYREEELREGVSGLIERYRELGFVEAQLLQRRVAGKGRVPVEIRVDREAKTVDVPVLVKAGVFVEARFEFAHGRRAEWTDKRLRKTIGLSAARRASQTYAEDAARQLERFLRERGHFHASVTPSLEDEAWVAPAGVPEGELPVIRRVRVLSFEIEPGPQVTWKRKDLVLAGNEAVSDKQVIQVLTEASPKALGHRPIAAVVIGVNDYRRFYTPEEMDGALGVLEDYYRARGYLSVQLSHTAEVPDAPGGGPGRKVQLRLDVVEGVQTSVESLEVDLGVPVRPETVEGWREALERKPFNPRLLDELVQQARRELGALGHLDARVSTTRELSEDRKLVRVRLQGDPGTAVRIGQTLVRESRHTDVRLMRREAGLVSGEVFDPARLAEAQARLIRTDLFDGVSLRAAERSGRVRDVELRVRERDRFSFVFGTGITWPDDGPRVNGEARARNLDGRGLSLFARGRASLDWRFLTPGVTPVPEWRAAVGLDLPWIPGVPLQFTLTGVLNEELDEPTYRVARSSIVLSARTRGLQVVSFSLRGQVQFREPLRVDPAAQLSPVWDKPAESRFTELRTLGLLGASLALDGRDDRLNPTKGLYFAATADTTLGNLPVDSPGFGVATARLVGIIPFGTSGVGLRIEGGGGVAWSFTEDLPPVEWRFRLGGIGSVRGFRLESIGPQGSRESSLASDGLLQGAHGLRQVSVGGNAFYRYSVELTIPVVFARGWNLAVFHDAGNALLYGILPSAVDAGLDPVLHPSVGLGLRRSTPIGPLRFDLAFRPGNLAAIFQGVEMDAGDAVQLHFAIGYL